MSLLVGGTKVSFDCKRNLEKRSSCDGTKRRSSKDRLMVNEWLGKREELLMTMFIEIATT